MMTLGNILTGWEFTLLAVLLTVFQSIRHGLMNVFAIMMSIFQVTRWFALIGFIPMVRLVGVFAWILVLWHGFLSWSWFLSFWIWRGFFDLRTVVLSTLGWDPSGFHGQTTWCDFDWKPLISLYRLIFFSQRLLLVPNLSYYHDCERLTWLRTN